MERCYSDILYSCHFRLLIVAEDFGTLNYIDEDHVDFLTLCKKVEEIVRVNWRGINVYLKPIYKYYYGLFKKMIMPMVEKIWTDNTLPDLVVRMTCAVNKVYKYVF